MVWVANFITKSCAPAGAAPAAARPNATWRTIAICRNAARANSTNMEIPSWCRPAAMLIGSPLGIQPMTSSRDKKSRNASCLTPQRSMVSTTISSSAPARPAACWPTGCRPIPADARAAARGRRARQLIWIHIPVGYLYCIGNPRTDWCYRTAAEPGLNGRALIYPRGKVLGGCSSINGMIYMRGQARDYDLWRQLGNRRLGLGRRAAALQAARGPLLAAPSDAARHAAASGGSSASACAGTSSTPSARRRQKPASRTVDDFNGGDNEGCGYFEVNQKRGVRWNASKAFLQPVLQPPQPAAR